MGRDALRWVPNFSARIRQTGGVARLDWGARGSRLASRVIPHRADLDGDVTEHIPTDVFLRVDGSPCESISPVFNSLKSS